MTDTRCWLEYKPDHALQKKIADGWFTGDQGLYLPIANFPAAFSVSRWTSVLLKWCKERGIEPMRVNVDWISYSAHVKKAQLQDFIQYVYGNDESLTDPAKMTLWKGRTNAANRFNDLRAFIAQELKPRLWYKLMADEF